MDPWRKLLTDETAASAVEYGLLIAGIAFMVFAGIMGLGQVVMNRLYSGAIQLFQ
jgi:Flp pilus assembly pilin Flp